MASASSVLPVLWRVTATFSQINQPHRAAPPHTVPHPPRPAAREPDMDPNTRGNPRPSPTTPQPRVPLVGVGTHAAPLPCCRALHDPLRRPAPLFVVPCLCAAGISLPQCGVCPASSVGSGTVGLFIINYYCQKYGKPVGFRRLPTCALQGREKKTAAKSTGRLGTVVSKKVSQYIRS